MYKTLLFTSFFLFALAFTRAHAAPNANYSLRFYGNGVNDIDRVKIKLDNPARPVDVGGSFTLEFWLKANAEDNTAQATCDVHDGWITGNIIFDRDVYGAGDYGDYGIALTEGRIAFGASRGNNGNTICGATNVADGAWHHIAVTRKSKNGALKIFVDGALDVSGTSAKGNISYRDGRATSYPKSDPFLVIGAEKHDAGSAYPSYSGFIDEVRISKGIRYQNNFSRPSQPFSADAKTLALYHFDAGSGNKILDSSNAVGGPSNGKRKFGGSPAGPEWSSETPF